MQTSPVIPRTTAAMQWFLFAMVAALYCYVGYASFGFDDEFYNIRIVRDNSLGAMVNIVQSTDIHPPLSYIINYILFSLLQSWNAVRLVSALFFVLSLGYVLYRTKDGARRWLLLLLLGMNPTILLWATSIRWYAYATPILLLLSVPPAYTSRYYWYRFFAGFLVIFYLGYIGFILFITYFIFYWLNDQTPFRRKVQRIIVPALLSGMLYAYQFFVFLTVHSKTKEEASNQQVFDLKANLASVLSTDFSNQGVFPLSVWGLISIVGMGIILVYALFRFREMNREKHWITFSVSALLFVIIGIAGKIRNLVLLEPARSMMIASIAHGKRKIIPVIGALLLLGGNAAGVCHVLLHTQTTKNAWNLPLQQVLETLDKLERPGDKEVYFTHSPTFTYYLTEKNKDLVSFYTIGYFDSSRIRTSIALLEKDTARKNFTFLLTYRGQSITPEKYAAMLRAMNELGADSTGRLHLGYDADHDLKKKYFPDYPAYEVEIIKFYGVRQPFARLAEWEKVK